MRDPATTTDRRPRGFTMVELLVVITIIGILVTFILVAAQDGIRRAQERATQELIAKLESGVAERLEAVLLRRADISLGHQALASIGNANFAAINNTNDPNYLLVQALSTNFTGTTQLILSPQRAQAIALFDIIRAQLPDVFYVQGAPYGGQYPLNFAGLDYPLGSGNFLVPLGATSAGAPGIPMAGVAGAGNASSSGDPNQAIGIFGASFAAAGGIYKNLGYLPQGYDGADNSNPPNGLVDEMAEGIGPNPSVSDPSNPSGPQVPLGTLIQRRLAAHTHITARSEMLYALLVEGGGPMGSVFNRDDFTNREVQDTDGDNLPEFVDAWGQPLQFFRWPIFYNNLSSTTLPAVAYSAGNPPPAGYVQKGSDFYNGPWEGVSVPMEPRQTDPLDPNQTLMSPSWWSSTVNTVPAAPNAMGYSSNAFLFMSYFHSLYDPNAGGALGVGALWDRSGFYPRRAFYSRFLILSAGPDETPGVAILPDAAVSAVTLIQVENQAGVFDVDPTTGQRSGTTAPFTVPGTTGSADLLTAGGDDITNQGMAAPGVGVR